MPGNDSDCEVQIQDSFNSENDIRIQDNDDDRHFGGQNEEVKV